MKKFKKIMLFVATVLLGNNCFSMFIAHNQLDNVLFDIDTYFFIENHNKIKEKYLKPIGKDIDEELKSFYKIIKNNEKSFLTISLKS